MNYFVFSFSSCLALRCFAFLWIISQQSFSQLLHNSGADFSFSSTAPCVTRVLFSRCQVNCCLDGHVKLLTIPCSLFSPRRDTSPSGFCQIYWSKVLIGGRGNSLRQQRLRSGNWFAWWAGLILYVSGPMASKITTLETDSSTSATDKWLWFASNRVCVRVQGAGVFSFFRRGVAVNNWLLCLPPAGLDAPAASASSLFRHAGDLAALLHLTADR